MTTERHAWTSLHLQEPVPARTLDSCPCGQELDTCTGHHCPRCGTSIAFHAA